MKKLIIFIIFFSFFLVPYAQEGDTEKPNVPTRPHYESTWLIESQSGLVLKKNTFQFMIQHRFGEIRSGSTDLWGLYLPSNIRLGLAYTPFENVGIGAIRGPVSLGYGTTKDNRMHDFNLKYGLVQQTEGNEVPVSITYFTNMAIEAEKDLDELPNENRSDRYSFFHQIIISRRFSPNLSVQVSPSVSHYNVVNPLMRNDHYAIGFGGRMKFSPQSSVLFNFDQPLTQHKFFNPQPSLSLGLEVATSSHSFQVFATNARFMIPQKNSVFNQNDPWGSDYFIGFNISRSWNF